MKRLLTLAALVVLLGILGVILTYEYTVYGPGSDQAQSDKARDDARRASLESAGLSTTENDYLAATTTKELAGIAWLAAHPGEVLPKIQTKATMELPAGVVHATVDGVKMELPLTYAWDSNGYAPLAKQLLGSQNNSDGDEPKSPLLTNLLEPTGRELGAADARISEGLGSTPSSLTLHEQAAMLLLTLGLRENAGYFYDVRPLLCRATAHLALARALRGAAEPDEMAKIAEATLCSLSGREVDALSQVDAMEKLNLSESGKVWARILQLYNKMDWRMESLTASDPLLLRIVWFNVLALNLGDTCAFDKLSSVASLDDHYPDWGRALIAYTTPSVEIGHRFCPSNLGVELKELGETLAAESKPLPAHEELPAIFNEALQNSVYTGKDGQTHEDVVGSALFKNITFRHIAHLIWSTHDWMRNAWGVPDEDEKFLQDVHQSFRGVLLEKELDNLILLPNRHEVTSNSFDEDISQLPVGVASRKLWSWGDESARYYEYFSWGIPLNAPNDLIARAGIICSVKPGSVPNQPTLKVPTFEDIRLLAPYSYSAASWSLIQADDLSKPIKQEAALERLKPFYDYNIPSLCYALSLVKNSNDVIKEELLRKKCSLDSDYNFDLGDFLRNHGRVDEAANVYRIAVARSKDPVQMANAVQPLVEYDFAHGQQDAGEALAKQAADVYSEAGIQTYIWVLCQEGKLSDAEDWANKLQERYGGNERDFFYVRYRDKFPDKYHELELKYFPDGLKVTTLASLSGRPTKGCRFETFTSSLEDAGLSPNDVVVALNSNLVSSQDTYLFVRAMDDNPVLDLIVWRSGKYLEIKASPPNRRFYSNILPYVSPGP